VAKTQTSMIHHIKEEWLLNLEEKLQIATLKSDRLEERLNKILARVSDVCDRSLEKPINDVPINNRPTFLAKLRQKLAIKRSE